MSSAIGFDKNTHLKSQIKGRDLVRRKAVEWLEIAEPSKKGQQYKFYGGNRKKFDMKGEEFILSGPADTGKTLACLSFLNAMCCEYPHFQAAIVRKEYASLPGTALQSFSDKVLKPDDGIIYYGGERHTNRYIYPNGSVIWTGGLDKASKVLSSQRDAIYVNQCEELELHDWQILKTRCTGRAGHAPFGMLFGDCNPAWPDHWIVIRSNQGTLKVIPTVHRDNPEIFDPVTGEITEGGKLRMAALESLSGTDKKRLFYGEWAQLEGSIYDCFDRDVHIIIPFPIPLIYPRIVGVDPLGESTAAIWLAYDPGKQALIVYREYSQPFGETTTGHAKNILRLSGFTEIGGITENTEHIVVFTGGGPTERQARADFAGAGLVLQEPAVSDVWVGIDKIYELIKNNQLFIFDDCVGLRDEISSYRRKMIDGHIINEIVNKGRYHLLDALRYAISWLISPTELVRVGRVEVPRIGAY